MSLVWRDAALEQQLHHIDELLRRNRTFWCQQAFTLHPSQPMPWEPEHPALAAALRELSFEQAETLASSDELLADFFRPLIADAAAVERAIAVPAIAALTPARTAAPEHTARRAPRDVPGRKWQQICEFANALPEQTIPRVLEWCAGKSHLGRLLARECGCVVNALEWNEALLVEGRHLAQRDKLSITFHACDVLSADAAAHIHADDCVVALHACGDLHMQLLRGVCARQPRRLLLSPCCYHLTAEKNYSPLSPSARRSALQLTRDDLRTAVQGTVTSPPRVQRQRKQLQAWRLGFDELQRDINGNMAYLPVPSLPLSSIRQGFAEFCRQVAQLKALPLPGGLNYSRYESDGYARLHRATAFDLPRLLFRRALEIWLVLDRALFLRDAGYGVEVGTFCPRALTPRNLLIRASRGDAVL